MSDIDEDLPRSLRLLWGHDVPQRRGPKPSLTIQEIGRAAVKLADAEDLGAVSMSRLAGDLGFTTMSLYRYVSSKDELYGVMVDTAYGDAPPEQDPGAGWRERLTAWCEADRAVLHRHPWVMQVPIVEPPLTPHQLGWMERGLQALSDTPLTDQEKLSSVLAANVYVRGMTQISAPLYRRLAETGQTEREADERYVRRLELLVDPERYPAVAATLSSGAMTEGDVPVDEFLFGLNTVLDGIEALVARRTL